MIREKIFLKIKVDFISPQTFFHFKALMLCQKKTEKI